MTGNPDHPGEGRFAERHHHGRGRGVDTEGELDSDQGERTGDAKRERRLAQTARELRTIFANGAVLADAGDESFETDMLIQRSSRTVITDLQETIERLPDRYRNLVGEEMRNDLRAMRVLLTHAYQRIEWREVAVAIKVDLPRFESALESVPGLR